MRQIKFRARIIDNSGWFIWKVPSSVDLATLAVDWETLCQFTGLLDRHGKEIYEGDIVKFNEWGFRKPENGIGVIEWEEIGYGIRNNNPRIGNLYKANDIEIIGNVYEHPHLLTPNPQR